MSNLTITLTAGDPTNLIRAQVELHGNTFTARVARSASVTAFGHTNGVTASALGVTYRMTSGGTRKIAINR